MIKAIDSNTSPNGKRINEMTYTKLQIEALKQIGSEWGKGDMHRVYFNNLADYLGLETIRYNTGNISSASLNGETISNSEAKRMLTRIGNTKIYFDLNEQSIKISYDHLTDDERETVLSAISAEMNELAAKLEEQPTSSNAKTPEQIVTEFSNVEAQFSDEEYATEAKLLAGKLGIRKSDLENLMNIVESPSNTSRDFDRALGVFKKERE